MNKKMKSVSTPLAPHFKLSDAMSPNNEAEREYMSRVPYANAIGSLMYVMVLHKAIYFTRCWSCKHVHAQSWKGSLAGCKMDSTVFS